MTVTELITFARRKYNATSDTFFSDSELYDLITQAQKILAQECQMIEATYTTSTVASTQEYALPTNTISVKRVTYAGSKLRRSTFREDDVTTLLSSVSTTTGTPAYYFEWDGSIFLRPIPDAVGTLKVYSINMPSSITAATSTIEVPAQFHMDIVDYLVSQMAAKDSNFNAAEFYQNLWNQHLIAAKKWSRLRKRGDDAASVLPEEISAQTYLGRV